MKVGLVSRLDRENAVELAEKIIDRLKDQEILLTPRVARKFEQQGVPIEKMNADALITIGGDGTVLYSFQRAPNTPVLGINMGGIGFLADVKPKEALKAVDELKKNNLGIIGRERIKVEISGGKVADALNEGVIRSQKPSQVLTCRISIDDEEIETIRGDGIIVATPTGSTAYAMSAGGPIIDPRVKAHLAVPLSAHGPKSLPLVFPRESKLEVELLETNKKADVTIDGQVIEEAVQNDIITFSRSDRQAKFFKWKERFYDKLKEKL